MRTRTLLLFAVLIAGAPVPAAADEPWAKATCRVRDMNFPVVDFHAHTFNLRHLPLRGILYGWGVPDFVAGLAAEMLWGLTGSIDAGTGAVAAGLRYEPGATDLSRPFRDRALGAAIDWFALPGETVDGTQQARFDEALNEYLVDEIQYERSLTGALRSEQGTPVTDYFMSLAATDPQASGFVAGGAFLETRETMLRGMALQDRLDKLVALLIKPFKLPGQVEGAFRFFYVMIQSEDKLAQMLLDENCAVDYFVHHMMDLEHVYDDAPPVRFREQHDIAKKVRDQNDERLVTFSAFVPFRYDDFRLEMLDYALASGAVGAKFYPPSGYNASVDGIPGKPAMFRGWIYQGGARKQWQHRYDPLNDKTTRRNWGVTVKNPRKAREETLTGVSAGFLAFARERQIPVFAHHTPEGFEAQPGYGKSFAEPCNWLPVLQAEPELQLVLGHAGGDAWYADDPGFDASFARQAFNLCVSYENVYCDFGYHEDVLTTGGQDALRDRLLTMHRETTAPAAPAMTGPACRSRRAPMKYPIFDKLLYGSDWMMVVKEPNHQQLLAAFDKVFVGDLATYKAAFFGGNALKVLRASASRSSLPGPLQ